MCSAIANSSLGMPNRFDILSINELAIVVLGVRVDLNDLIGDFIGLTMSSTPTFAPRDFALHHADDAVRLAHVIFNIEVVVGDVRNTSDLDTVILVRVSPPSESVAGYVYAVIGYSIAYM